MYNHNAQLNVLKLFNALVVSPTTAVGEVDRSLVASHGIVTDFTVSKAQKSVIVDNFKPLDVRTLFGRTEIDNASAFELISKQVLHYIEVYGLDLPGVFDLEVTDGKILSMKFVRGITVEQLGDQVRQLLYTNAPVKDSDQIKQIITDFGIEYDVNLIANNELRVALYDSKRHVFEKGDDAVRYIVMKATGSTMLIKSNQVIEAVRQNRINTEFFEKHDRVLAQVFNRHKKILLAAKNSTNKSVINRITRLSKKHHVPVFEPVGKRFISLALKGKVDQSVLKTVNIRDKFKMLNLVEYKLMGHDQDAFIIRNGKIHLKADRKVQDTASLEGARDMLVSSLTEDLSYLKGKKILLDQNVDYGLPVSRKQTLGNLPYGTTVTVSDGKISSGIYWENAWGSTDLDLSTIDTSGRRTGWGTLHGYNKSNPVRFSGDLTDARDGAMEFMTSTGVDYGLFVNIFTGTTGSEFELVVGRDGKDRWIQDVAVREKSQLNSRGNVIGFVKDNKFVVYQGQLNNSSVSRDSKSKAIVARGTSKFWTLTALFDALGIDYELDRTEDTTYDYDLSYANFSYDKLEDLLIN